VEKELLSFRSTCVGLVLLVFSFLCSVSRSLLVLLAIVLFVYRGFMNSDYPFGIFQTLLNKNELLQTIKYKEDNNIYR
jgi:hypothetical protein